MELDMRLQDCLQSEGWVKTLEDLSKGVYSHKQGKYLLSYKTLSGPQRTEDLNASSGNYARVWQGAQETGSSQHAEPVLPLEDSEKRQVLKMPLM